MPLAVTLGENGYSVIGTKKDVAGYDSDVYGKVTFTALELMGGYPRYSEPPPSVFAVDTLIITLPGSRQAEHAQRTFSDIRYLVAKAREAGARHIIYTSTTSVYGFVTGMLTETSPVRPASPGGTVMAEIERYLLQQKDMSIDILRLAGLIGPDRHPARSLSGRTNLPEGDHGVNLVHRDDVIEAIQLLIRSRGPCRLYNLCSPSHPARRDFYTQLCKENGLPAPEYNASDNTVANKMIDGSLICRELGFKYAYSSPHDMPYVFRQSRKKSC